MTDLSTPTHLRALVEALPSWVTSGHWEAHAVSVNTKGHWPLAECGPASDGLNPIYLANLIATVASPPVVLALADLLAELHETDTMFMPPPVRAARDALEAAIHRTPEGAA